MKQIKYTEKQKIVLEVLEQVDKEFKSKYNYRFENQEHFEKINRIKKFFGIKEKYLTLREHINEHSCGAYHSFIFEINGIRFKTMDVSEFKRYYNPELLDKYFVINDKAESNGGNCENYHCEHYLELAQIEFND